MNLKEDYALSSNDIRTLVDTNVISYDELRQINNIKDVMKNGSVVILYESKEGRGHWVTLKENKEGDTIYFLDSYGMLIDDEFNFINDDFIKTKYDDDRTTLRRLLYNSDYKEIEYNEKQLQSFKEGVNTCGRYAVAFIYSGLTLDEFVYLLTHDKSKSPDEIVLGITNYLFLNQ